MPLFQPLISLVVLTLLSACSYTQTLHTLTPNTVHFGTPSTLNIKVDNLHEDTQLAVMPSGPHLKYSLKLNSAALEITHYKQLIVASTQANQIAIIRYDSARAAIIKTFQLRQPAKKLLVYKHDLYFAQGTGLFKIALDVQPFVITPLYQAKQSIDDLFVNDDAAYLVCETQLLTLDPTKNNAPFTLKQAVRLKQRVKNIQIYDGKMIAINEHGIASYDINQRPIERLDYFRTSEPTVSFSLQDNLIFGAMGKAGMLILEMNQSGQLRWLGSHNKLANINKISEFNPNVLVLENPYRVASINVKRRQLPITGSLYKSNSIINDIDTREDTAILATANSIDFVDFGTEARFQISDEGINFGGSRRAHIVGDKAYVADWFSGLHIYDLSVPNEPRHIGNYHTPGSSKGVIVRYPHAFVADDDHGLQILDISNASQPIKVSEVHTAGLAYTMKLVQNTLYLADHRGGFHIVDLSDIQHPTLVGSYNTPGKSWAIDVKDDIAFVADDNSGLLIFDVKDSKNIKQVGQFNPQGYAEDVTIRGNIAYVSFFDQGLFILDIKNPSDVNLLGHIDIPGNARSVTVRDGIAYIAAWESGIQLVDVSNPATPKLMGHYDTSGAAWGLDLHNEHAYVWDWWGGIKVIDISNTHKLHKVAQFQARGDINHLIYKNKFLYAAHGSNGLHIYDMNNPLNPIWASAITLSGNAVHISSGHNHVFIAMQENGINAVNVSNPFTPKFVTNISLPGRIIKTAVLKNNLYALSDYGELVKLNIKNPKSTYLQSTIGYGIKDIAANVDNLFLLDDANQILQLDSNNNIVEWPQPYGLNSQGIDSIYTYGNQVYLVSQNTVLICVLRTDNSECIGQYNVGSAIRQLFANTTDLYITTDEGLSVLDIETRDAPVLHQFYPATAALGSMVIADGAAFFASHHSIASVALIAKINFSREKNGNIMADIPGNFDIGNYDLLIKTGQYQTIIRSAFSVKMRKSKRPKMSIEKFKELLKQHQNP